MNPHPIQGVVASWAQIAFRIEFQIEFRCWKSVVWLPGRPRVPLPNTIVWTFLQSPLQLTSTFLAWLHWGDRAKANPETPYISLPNPFFLAFAVSHTLWVQVPICLPPWTLYLGNSGVPGGLYWAWEEGGSLPLCTPVQLAWDSLLAQFFPARLFSLLAPVPHFPSVLTMGMETLLFAGSQGQQLSRSSTLSAVPSFPWSRC